MEKIDPEGPGFYSHIFLVPKVTYLRKRAIALFPYLDDLLVRNQIRPEILRDRQFTVELIMSLGLIIL